MRQGSYVLHRQHALAHRRQNPNNSESLDHCSKQRYLPDEGKIQPRHIGDAIRRLNIPIVTVNSNPYWRCVDTADMAFGPTARAPDLRFTISINAEDTRCLLEALRISLPTAARAGSNAELLSHTGYPNEVAAVWPKPEGVLGVFNLLGGNQFKYLGLITPEQWA